MPRAHKNLCQEKQVIYTGALFSASPLSYPFSAPKQQGKGTNEQHEQETQRCEARFREQMVQTLLYFTEGHSLGLYTSFIKLDLNWCSHPDSRNHHASFPFKRGNKHLISKAVSIRGSPSPSLALCLTKPPRQSCLPYRWPSEVQRAQVFCL